MCAGPWCTPDYCYYWPVLLQLQLVPCLACRERSHLSVAHIVVPSEVAVIANLLPCVALFHKEVLATADRVKQNFLLSMPDSSAKHSSCSTLEVPLLFVCSRHTDAEASIRQLRNTLLLSSTAVELAMSVW